MKDKMIYFIAGIISFIVFSLVLFLLWKDRSIIFWTTYGFLIFALCGFIANVIGMVSKNEQFAANLTLVVISAVYLVFSAGWSILAVRWTMLAEFLFKKGSNIYLAIHIALCGIFLIIWLLGFVAVRHINSQDN